MSHLSFSFCKESISRVKEFLVEYCNGRKTNGYIMLQDPLSSFYEAICVGLDWDNNAVTGDLIIDDPGSIILETNQLYCNAII